MTGGRNATGHQAERGDVIRRAVAETPAVWVLVGIALRHRRPPGGAARPWLAVVATFASRSSARFFPVVGLDSPDLPAGMSPRCRRRMRHATGCSSWDCSRWSSSLRASPGTDGATWPDSPTRRRWGLSGPADPRLVPDRPVRLVTRPSAPKTREAVRERQAEPPVVGHRGQTVRQRRRGLLQRLSQTRSGCRSARRGAARSRPTARAGGSGSAPADRRTGSRSAAHPHGPAVAVQRPAASSRGRPGQWSSPRWRISSSVRPCRPACSWVWERTTRRTAAPSRTVPVCRTGSGRTSRPAGARRQDRSRRGRAAARSATARAVRPHTATRSPYQTSRSKGRMRSVSSRCSAMTARLAVRPPESRIRSRFAQGTGFSLGRTGVLNNAPVCAAW